MIPLVALGATIWFGTANVAQEWGYLQAVVWLGSLVGLVVLAAVFVALSVQLAASLLAGTRTLTIVTAVFSTIDLPVILYGHQPLLSDPSWWSVVVCAGVALQLVAFVGVIHHARIVGEHQWA